MWDIEVFEDGAKWSLRLAGEPSLASFATFDQAENRARWMATRQTVRGADAQVRLLDAHGREIGRWVDECFIAPAQPNRRAA